MLSSIGDRSRLSLAQFHANSKITPVKREFVLHTVYCESTELLNQR